MKIEGSRDGEELRRRHRDLLGVASAGEQRTHSVTDVPVVHALTEFGDDTRAFEAEYLARSWRRRILALPLHQIGAVDGGGGHIDDDLPALRPRVRYLGPAHDLGCAELGEGDCMHGSRLPT